MRRTLPLAAIVALATMARAAEPPGGDPALVELLSGIDYVPGRGSLDDVLGDAAEADLIAIARGEVAEAADPGLRIRAYRALALYPDPETIGALREAVSEHAGVEDGIDIVYLRAVVDSLAEVAGAGAVDDLVPLLDHPSRDVRAAAAIGLGDTDSDTAVAPLRARLSVEEIGQVRLAIAEALRRLEGD